MRWPLKTDFKHNGGPNQIDADFLNFIGNFFNTVTVDGMITEIKKTPNGVGWKFPTGLPSRFSGEVYVADGHFTVTNPDNKRWLKVYFDGITEPEWLDDYATFPNAHVYDTWNHPGNIELPIP